MLSNLAGKKHTKKAVQEAAQQRLALDKGQKIDNKSQKVNENKLDLDKENVDQQLNQEEEKSFKCIFCGESGAKYFGVFLLSFPQNERKMYQFCSVCIFFEGSVFTFQSLNDKILNLQFF